MGNKSTKRTHKSKDDRLSGKLLLSHTPISFWGGVHPATGDVIDEHHPLNGENISGRILAIPGSRGSCSGSSVLLELLDSDKAPAAIIFSEHEEILVLGAIIARVMFTKSLTLMQINTADFAQLEHDQNISIVDDTIYATSNDSKFSVPAKRIALDYLNESLVDFHLTQEDKTILRGDEGKAAQVSMQIVLQMAKLQGATELINIQQAHIDGCVYNGMSNLKFAEQLVDWGGTVKVPTTLNALSVDQRQWRSQGIDPSFGVPASAVGDAYVAMGAQNSFTCAPYLLNTAPTLGEQIVWAESNAVAYANSVLGAKTQKYPDFLDICIALTGRAPRSGTHMDSDRVPAIIIEVPVPEGQDDSFWPLLGYHIGLIAPNVIPMIKGLEKSTPSNDELKAFSAAFATTSAVPMFHIAEVTPESASIWNHMSSIQIDSLSTITVSLKDLLLSWRSLNTARSSRVDMICLGNPHFSHTEVQALAKLCTGRVKQPHIDIIVTLGRSIYQQSDADELIAPLRDFGVQFIMDTCWCMLEEPVIPPKDSMLMTNSGKYAHYGPGLVKRPIHFGSLADCVNAACEGERSIVDPFWLQA